MKYKESEVLDILRQFTDKPKKVINKWNTDKSNNFKDVELNQYIYSFPIIIKGKKVGLVTLANLYSSGLDRDDIMQKYFGHMHYKKTWETFSHDTYMFCYLTTYKSFKLDKLAKGFYGQTLTVKDANDIPFDFTISFGSPEKEKDMHLFENFARSSTSYSFDNDVNIKVDKPLFGWTLSDKIKDNIRERLRDQTINEIIK